MKANSEDKNQVNLVIEVPSQRENAAFIGGILSL